MGLNTSSVRIRNWLHSDTVRIDFQFDSVNPDFGLGDSYAQSLYMHIIYMMLLMLACLITIHYFRNWSLDQAQLTENLPPLPQLKYTKIARLVLPIIIILLCISALIAYIIAFFVSLKIRRRYGNTAFTVIEAIHKGPIVSRSLNKIMDIVLAQYYLLGYLIDRFVELFVSTIKKFDFAAARTAGQVAPSYRMLTKIRNLNFYSLIFGPVIVIAGVATGITAAYSTISSSYVLQGVKFFILFPAMMLWWVIAGLVSPVILAMADVCVDPVQSVITVVEKDRDEVSKGLVAYYLDCKGKNPVEDDLATMKKAIKTVEDYVTSFKGKPKQRKIIAAEMVTVTEFNKYLSPRCDWSQRAFTFASQDLCRATLVSYFTMWVCAISLGIFITFLIIVIYLPRIRPDDKKLKEERAKALKAAKDAKFLEEQAKKLKGQGDTTKDDASTKSSSKSKRRRRKRRDSEDSEGSEVSGYSRHRKPKRQKLELCDECPMNYVDTTSVSTFRERERQQRKAFNFGFEVDVSVHRGK